MTEADLIEDLRLLAPPSYAWAWGLLFVLGVAAGLTIVWRLTRRLHPPTNVKSAPPPAPWDLALAQLEHLLPLLAPERSREYGIQSTGVLRRYVEARHHLRAPRLATEEFLVAAAQSPTLPAAHRESLGRFLVLCDLFKFGRYLATAEELRQLHSAAVEFVLASQPLPDEPPTDGGTA